MPEQMFAQSPPCLVEQLTSLLQPLGRSRANEPICKVGPVSSMQPQPASGATSDTFIQLIQALHPLIKAAPRMSPNQVLSGLFQFVLFIGETLGCKLANSLAGAG